MCPASTSTTTPSGIRSPVAMIFLSEPSGFTENTRPSARSRMNRREFMRSSFLVSLQWLRAVSSAAEPRLSPLQEGRRALALVLRAGTQREGSALEGQAVRLPCVEPVVDGFDRQANGQRRVG